MSLIVLERGSLSFGPQQVIAQISLRIGEGEKIGLIGANGSGKSTLLRIMTGEQSLDAGQVHRSRGCRIGYLPQDVTEVPEGSLLASVLAAVPGRSDLEELICAAEQHLAASDDQDEQLKIATELAELHDRQDHFDLYYNEHQAIRILKGLGFSQEELQRAASELSGGWRMRAALAGLLFQKPDVLFLDEPTNHLDVPSVIWLDRFLNDYRHAVVLICHDREFLNRHIRRVVSFEPEGLRTYQGDYDAYLEQRAEEEEVLEARAHNQERQVRELSRFVERFKAKANKARQAQSRAKQIKRMEQQMDKPVIRRRSLNFTFPPTDRTGRDVLMLEGVQKAYGDHVLYRGLTRGVYAGDRVAIIGPNGVGKTTLLKMMASEISLDAGVIRLGSNVKLGYFAQHHAEQLNERRTVLEEVRTTSPTASESFVRGVCGAFLFSGDDVDKVVGILSGGERARVLLARLLVNPGNVLLMDEPTTHLDIAAAEALAGALKGYQGTLVFVSHNTSFVNRLATKIWDVRDHDLVEYPGNLAEYLEHQARQEQRAAAAAEALEAKKRAPRKSHGKKGGQKKGGQKKDGQKKDGQKKDGQKKDGQKKDGQKKDGQKKDGQKKDGQKKGGQKKDGQKKDGPGGERMTEGRKNKGPDDRQESRQNRKDRKRQEARLRNELSRNTRKARAKVDEIELRIEKLEDEQKELESQLADPVLCADAARYPRAVSRYRQVKDRLEKSFWDWEQRNTELEEITAEFNERTGGET